MLRIKYNFDISNISYIKVGGKVKLYIETDEIEVVREILKVSKKIKYIGNTSNIFFSFSYNSYIFIKYIDRSLIIEKVIEAGSGLSLRYLINKLCELDIGGMEKLIGIPCLVGGGIVNNISSFNQEISSLLIDLLVMDIKGNIFTLKKENIIFSYHYSSLVHSNLLILKARFYITKLNKITIKDNINEVTKIRHKLQPHNRLTLGSTFRKYEDICIPRIIEELELKGYKIGKCEISRVHSNFLEVTPKSNYLNIISLIELTNRLLYNKLGYYIDLEIEQIRGVR